MAMLSIFVSFVYLGPLDLLLELGKSDIFRFYLCGNVEKSEVFTNVQAPQ